MARTVRDAALESRTARERLAPRGEPYYKALEPGLLHLGYRKPKSGTGKWLARCYVGNHSYRYHPIGLADDFSDADGRVILSYSQAQKAARKLMVELAGGGIGTIADTTAAYLKSLEAEGRPPAALSRTRYNIDALILPVLGDVELTKLTYEQLKAWFDGLVRKPARRKGRRDLDETDADRARRATANRIRTTLVAALNVAFRAGHVSSDHAWRRLRPFRGVDKARVRYLSVAEAKRLINAASPDFRQLLQGALLTGARYGQLAQLTVSDLNTDAGTLRLRTRKGDGSERAYHAHLSDEALAFFRAAVAGRPGKDLIFTHADGTPWEKSHQDIPIEEASRHAGISPPVNFHVTRHTFASHAVMNGAPLLVVAQALGHTDTRMVEKHYSHLAPSYAADAIRKAAPIYGIKPGNVRPLHRKA